MLVAVVVVCFDAIHYDHTIIIAVIAIFVGSHTLFLPIAC